MKSCKNKRREMKTANMVMTSMHKQKRPKSLTKTWSNSFLKVSQNTQRMKISDTVAQVIQMRLLLIKFYLYPFRWLLDQPVRVKFQRGPWRCPKCCLCSHLHIYQQRVAPGFPRIMGSPWYSPHEEQRWEGFLMQTWDSTSASICNVI